jgi:hypothetical protein
MNRIHHAVPAFDQLSLDEIYVFSVALLEQILASRRMGDAVFRGSAAHQETRTATGFASAWRTCRTDLHQSPINNIPNHQNSPVHALHEILNFLSFELPKMILRMH